MQDYWTQRNQILKFLDESKISAFDLVRIGKDLCCCGTCSFFVQHYLKDGSTTDFGHCKKNKIPRQTRKFDPSCGSWKHEERKVEE